MTEADFDEKPTGKLRWKPKFGVRHQPPLPQDWCRLQQQFVWYGMDGEPNYVWHDVLIEGEADD